MPQPPLCVIVAVGLSPRHLHDPSMASVTPTLRDMARTGGVAPLATVGPAVTLASQATMLTGEPPSIHGVVGNGWHFRETDEIRFWQQSRRLISGPLLYETARARCREANTSFNAAKLFGWFNQGADVEWSITPKPWYGADGSKEFDIHGKPEDYVNHCRRLAGRFPFHAFWGPMAGAASTQWIARVAAETLIRQRPAFTLVYLPHLDYDLQRFGPHGPHTLDALEVLDNAVAQVAHAAGLRGSRVVVLSEYGIVEVRRSVALNRELRKAGLLAVRNGPFGELIDVPECQAVAVADHQVAHVSVRDPARTDDVAAMLRDLDGVGSVLVGDERASFGVDHPRAGEVVVLAEPDAWFSYEYWLQRRYAPDFAPTVDIHRKPGFDPQEMFFNPRLRWPKLRAALRVLRKKCGMRYLMDVIPVDQPGLVHGSHGLPASNPDDGAVVLTNSPDLAGNLPKAMTDVHDWLLRAMVD
ncbi:MAG: alkaline phosphatase family protein [Planctomycetota bacterium]